MAKRSGEVTNLTYPDGNGPVTCKIGGRMVRIWPTDKEDLDNPVLAKIEAAYENDEEISVVGYTKTYNGKAQFYATDIEREGDDEDEDDEDDAPRKPQKVRKPAAKKAPYKKRAPAKKEFVGRKPGEADNWVAIRGCIALAIEQVRHEKAEVWNEDGLTPEVLALAKSIFQAGVDWSLSLLHKEAEEEDA